MHYFYLCHDKITLRMADTIHERCTEIEVIPARRCIPHIERNDAQALDRIFAFIDTQFACERKFVIICIFCAIFFLQQRRFIAFEVGYIK